MLTKLLTKDLATALAFLAAQPVGKAVTCLDLLHEGNHDDRAVALMLALNDAYRQGKPLVSDATWDALYDWCEHKLSDDHWHAVSTPGGDEGGSAGTPDEAPGKTIPVIVGSVRLAAMKEIPLAWYMSSRTKAKPTNKLLDKLLASARELDCELVIPDKLDGIALQLRYLDGKLVSVATQGKDGCIGTDVTHVMQHCPSFPKTLPGRTSACIRAEGIFPRAARAELERLSGKTVALRNCAGGSIRRLQADQRILHLHVVALQLFGQETGSYADSLETLEGWGFITPAWETRPACEVTPEYLNTRFAATRSSSGQYEADGLVVSLDTLPPREDAADGNPDAWSLAYKEADEAGLVKTVVSHVAWNCTKGGLWAPTIHVEPVVVGGVRVSKVSGVNGYFIRHGYTKGEADAARKLGNSPPARPINTGTILLLERSGDVVPNVSVVVTGAAEAATPPGAWREAGVEYLVTDTVGEVSVRMLANQMNHSLKVLGFKGWGVSMLEEVVAGWAQRDDFSGLTTWHNFIAECLAAEPEETWRAWLVDIPRRRELVVQQVQQLQTLLHNAGFEKWFVASGIFQGIAETTAKALATALADAATPCCILSRWSKEHELALARASGFGPETIALLRSGWPEWIALLDCLDLTLDEFDADDPVLYGGGVKALPGAETNTRSPYTESVQAALLAGDAVTPNPLPQLFYLSGVRNAELVAALTGLGMTEQKSFNPRKVDVLLYRSARDKGVQKKLDVTDPAKAMNVLDFLRAHGDLFTPAFLARIEAALRSA